MLNHFVEQQLHSARILIVADNSDEASALERILTGAGYSNLVSTGDASGVAASIGERLPALMLVDISAPRFDGLALMAATRENLGPDDLLPILVLTSDSDSALRQRALSAGALDFIAKPLDQSEVLMRVHNALALGYLLARERAHNAQALSDSDERARQLEQSNQMLEHANAELASANAHLQWAHREIEQAQNEIVNRLVEAVEVRSEAPSSTLRRVGQLAEDLAREMGLDERQIVLIRHAAPLHDIGKIGVSEAVLLKPSALTPAEWQEARSHVEIGAAMLSKSEVSLMQMAESIAYTHHERWDGQGYPRGLKGEETPIEGRILAVVDVFDALTTERPYKQAWTPQQAMSEIEAQSERQFDPSVVSAFSRLMHRTNPME